MKTKYEFRKKALAFARKDEMQYDAVHVEGIYEDYEAYTPYCKKWKDNPPMIGLPHVILVNDKEVKWGDFRDPFSILRSCKKIPSLVFEYDCMCWFGNSYNIKVLADGTLLKFEYGYSKLGSEDRMQNDNEEVVLVNSELVTEIKKIAKDHKDKLKSLPRELLNYHILDGANETVRIGGLKFEGSNMFTEDMTEYAEKYKDCTKIPD